MTLQKPTMARPQPKISLLTLAALAIAATPTACADEFTSCEDTQTCKDDERGGDAGEGGDGSGAMSGVGGTDTGDGGVGAKDGGGAVDSGGMGAVAGASGADGSAGDGSAECTRDEECAWSSCDEGRCARAVKIAGASSGGRCALRDVGDILCWGGASGSFLGREQETSQYVEVPTLVAGTKGAASATGVVDIALGGSHACSLQSSGEVFCWGRDVTQRGVLGTGAVSDDQPHAPAPVKSLSGSGVLTKIVAITGSASGHTCALRDTEDVVCWGANGRGELGNGSRMDSGVPTLVSGVEGAGTLRNIVQLELGSFGSCAVNEGGNVLCWGGSLISDGDSLVPLPIPAVGGIGNLADVRQVSVGGPSACALLNDGQVVCWGANVYGALGRGDVSTTPSYIPDFVVDENGEPLTDIVEVACGGGLHTCALTSMGEVFCWGINDFYQLGQSSSSPLAESPVALRVAGIDGQGFLSGVTGLGEGGFGFSCAIREAGDVVCWGLIAEVFDPYDTLVSRFPAVIEKPQF